MFKSSSGSSVSAVPKVNRGISMIAPSVFLLCSAVLTSSASAQSRAAAGRFVPVLLWPKVAAWQTSTDATARDSGSSSIVSVEAENPGQSFVPGVRFRGILGRIDGDAGPVGFVRSTTNVSVDATGLDSLALPIGAENPALAITVLLQDSSQARTSEWFEATVSQARGLRPGVGLIGSGVSIIRFADFKRIFRGRQVPGPSIDQASIRGFGIQLARSTQPAILRDGGDITFNLVLAGVVSAINTTTESVRTAAIEAATRSLESKSARAARDILNEDELRQIRAASDDLFETFAPRPLSSRELDQVFGNPIYLNTIDIGIANGNGRPLPSRPSNGNPQQKLNSLADIRSIMVTPSVTKAWLRSLMIDFAVANYPAKIVTPAGAIRLDRDSFRSFMAQKLRALGYRTKPKTESFSLPDGSFGLSQDVILSLGQSVVFDQSSFSGRVGEFSFPMIAGFYAAVLAEVPASEKLAQYSVPAFFADITAAPLRNQFEGWRLWQRMFANQDAQVAGSINSLDWWRQLLESAVVD